MYLRHDSLAGLLVAALVTAGCAGPLIKDAPPREAVEPLHAANDEHIHVVLENVVIRNGAGAWAYDADWDEYRLLIKAQGADIDVREVAIVDALGTRIALQTERSDLAKGTREMEERYQSSGQLARTGSGIGWVAIGGATAATGYAAAVAAAPAMALSGGAAAGALVVVPILMIGGGVLAGVGINRMIDNAQLNGEIQRRQTPLPAPIARGEEKRLTLFFPLTPLPRATEIVYMSPQGERRLALDTRTKLATLHSDQPPTLLSRTEPEFPLGAIRGGITYGRVKARLSISLNGSVDKVAILESHPPGIFDREAARTMVYWKYNVGTFGDRSAIETLEFKR